MTYLAHHSLGVEFRGVTLYWYGLAYLVSFLWIGWQSKLLLRRNGIWGFQEPPIPLGSVNFLVASLAVGVVGGGRLGSIFEFLLSGRSAADSVTLGGMSSFGAFAGALAALAAFSRFNRTPFCSTLDLVAFSAPGCILFIRVANFVNGDLVGVPIRSPLVSTVLGGIQNHPVALYEAIGEGLIPLLLLRICVVRLGWLKKPGSVTGLFALLYAVARGALIAFRDLPSRSIPGIQFVAVLCCIGLAIIASAMLLVAWTRSSDSASRRVPTIPSWHGSRLADAAYLAVVVSVSLPLGGCGGNPPSPGPRPAFEIVYTNPGQDPQCPCANSKGAYAQNSTDTARQVSWTALAKDTFTGHQEVPATGTASVPGGQKLFLGCSIYAPSNQCRYQADYQLNQAAALRTNLKRSAVFGASPSIASCKAACSDPNDPLCLTLGVRYYKAVAPLAQMVEAAQQSGGNVSKADVMKRYNLKPSDDKCQRGDIKNSGGRLTNEGGTEKCKISSADLPTLLKALKLDSLEGDKPLTQNTWLPQHVEAEPTPNIRALDATNVLVFPLLNSAPIIDFEGAGGAKLTHDFGGAVQGVAEIKPPGSRAQTIIVTENGCMAVDEP